MTNKTNPASSEPVACAVTDNYKLAFVCAVQSCVTDLTQQYALINMYDLAHPTHTLSAAEFGQVFEALRDGLTNSCELYTITTSGMDCRQYQEDITGIKAAIALLEKVKP